ncbi:hypothetical protein XENOCAPTIV_006373, partial [Xenoophorus captivus]
PLKCIGGKDSLGLQENSQTTLREGVVCYLSVQFLMPIGYVLHCSSPSIHLAYPDVPLTIVVMSVLCFVRCSLALVTFNMFPCFCSALSVNKPDDICCWCIFAQMFLCPRGLQ